jgi:hypothetical protein
LQLPRDKQPHNQYQPPKSIHLKIHLDSLILHYLRWKIRKLGMPMTIRTVSTK